MYAPLCRVFTNRVTYYEYENTVTYIYTLGTGGLPDTPKNWIFVAMWKIIYSVELIVLQNKA